MSKAAFEMKSLKNLGVKVGVYQKFLSKYIFVTPIIFPLKKTLFSYHK